MSFRIFTLFSILTLGLFACGGEDTGANNGGDQNAGNHDAGTNGELIGRTDDVGTPCLTHADCEGLVCTRSEVGYVCSSDCHSNDDCVPGWTCEPRITEPGNICVCRGDGKEICDGLDNNCDGQVDEGEPWKLGCGLDGTCEEGICTVPPPTYTPCGPNGEEVDLSRDPYHCGRCDNPCESRRSCVDGKCGTLDLRTHCRDNAEAWRVTEFKVESEFGFDLDAHNTTVGSDATPATGCGIEDGLHGIDNSFAALWDRLADEDAALDFNSAVTDALHDGSFEIMAYIRGYEEGRANDNIELTLIINRVEYPELVDVEAELVGGKIIATLDRLPLPLSGIEFSRGGITAELNHILDMRHVRVEIAEPGTETSSLAILGGGVQVGGEGGIQADIEKLIDDLGASELFAGFGGVANLMAAFSDLSSNGADCDSLSLGAQLRFTYDVTCE